MTRAELLRLRRILRCPIIESFSRLPTQESRPHHLTKNRTWAIFGVLEFLHQHFRYGQGRIQADVIEELQGPMGQLSPRVTALSMSSGSATPSLTRSVASFRAWTSIRLTMKPGESFLHSTVSLPICFAAPLMDSTVASEVLAPRMTSMSGISCGGLKKCMPTMFSGFFVAEARSVMLMEEVFDASIALVDRCSETLR